MLRSILTLLRASARSLDVADINLPLMLSDIPEAIANWQGGSHVVYERFPFGYVRFNILSLLSTFGDCRSVDEDENNGDNPMAPIHNYLSMLRTDKRCISHFLCEYWKKRTMEEESFLDVVMFVSF